MLQIDKLNEALKEFTKWWLQGMTKSETEPSKELDEYVFFDTNYRKS